MSAVYIIGQYEGEVVFQLFLRFMWECINERIIEIGQHLAELLYTGMRCLKFLDSCVNQ